MTILTNRRNLIKMLGLVGFLGVTKSTSLLAAEKSHQDDGLKTKISDLPTVDTIEGLRTLTTGTYVWVGGYYAKGDGGEGLFYWDAQSTLPDNQGTLIQP